MKEESFLNSIGDGGFLRFITCGSVDDGKSTLIGRILYDSKSLFDDKLSSIQNESKKYGTTGDEIDLALAVDGLQAEREQGITIDVAYIFFNTKNRKYIIADTPGHEQYTRNMATGASSADAAVVLIDARKGVLTQTKRHVFIANLLGLQHIIVAVNKMDIVGYDKDVFERIKKQFESEIGDKLQLKNVHFLPISALKGDNIVTRSEKMDWYEGNSLLELLDALEVSNEKKIGFRFPVQYVNRPDLNFRGYCGSVIGGSIEIGDKAMVLPSGKRFTVKDIVKPSIEGLETEKSKAAAVAGDTITLVTSEEIDISRGDVIVREGENPHVSSIFAADILWMDEEHMDVGRRYDMKLGFQNFVASIKRIEYRVDPNTYQKEIVDHLALNDIALCQIECERDVVFDTYKDGKETGSFIIIDRITNKTVGAGMIEANKYASEPRNVNARESFEVELNALVRKHFPHWESKEIF